VKKAVFMLAAILLCLTLLNSCDMIMGLFLKTGFITGYVYDSSTEAGLGGVLITAAGTDESTTTNSSGYFTIELPEGTQTLRFSKTGYTFYDVVVTVTANSTEDLTEDVVGYAPLSSGEIRIVLTWGSDPGDLDSHLYIPGTGDEIYYSNQTASDNTADLDWDDTDGYGPETTTISTQKSGTYYYSVYNYSQEGSFVTTRALVRVYNSSGLWKTYQASSASGDGTNDWWRVFSLNGGTITTIGTFNDTAGDTWAGIE
jgi:hypothetical protein